MATPMTVGSATDQPTSPNMPSPNQALRDFSRRARALRRASRPIFSSSGCLARRRSSRSAMSLLLQLVEAPQGAGLQPEDGRARLARVLVQFQEALPDMGLQPLELVPERAIQRRNRDQVAALDQQALVDGGETLAPLRLVEREHAGHQRGHEIDVSRQQAETAVGGGRRDLASLFVHQDLG